MSEPVKPCPPDLDSLKLEIVTVCVGFDDFLDVTLQANHPHADSIIVVTTHEDKKTHAVCRKHGAICVQTDLHKKNGRKFNKGAMINAGFGYFQYNGWRMHLDADIVLPDNFRRIVFNHHHLDRYGLYGCDRIDIIGVEELRDAQYDPQHKHGMLVHPGINRGVGARFIDKLNGYLPLGYFQMWNAKTQKSYPYTIGTAAHDDTVFSALWPERSRHLLPGVFCYHLCARPPRWGENWDGDRKMPRLEKPKRKK